MSEESSGQADTNPSSTKPPSELISRLGAAIKGEVILFPIIVKSEMEDARVARVLMLSRNAGIPRTYISFRLPQREKAMSQDQEKAAIMWRLKVICDPLSARFSAVSSPRGRFLVCVSYSNTTTKSLDLCPLEGG